VRLTSRDALRIFDIADIWASRTRSQVRLVSANDHVHSRSSAHYAGVALDLHSSDPAGLAAALKRAGYRVLWNVRGHYGHVHAEQATGDRPRATGDRRQATGDGPQATGDRRQASGDRRQATGDRRQTTGGGPQAAGNRPRATG
jgi:hypothetical protein